jgi:hypothetical protein
MNTQLLIDAVVRQTTILIAQLATSGGSRTPLADVANQIFADLARELHRQGVSRKVAADMFGMALRTYRRKVQRLSESQTVSGRSLWEAVHDYIGQKPLASRTDVLQRFHRDDEEMVRGVLQDLVESGFVYSAGRGATVTYRTATREELDYAREVGRDPQDTDALVWALVYRLGPLTREKLGAEVALPATELDASLARLVVADRVERGGPAGAYAAHGLVIPLGESRGWEAAVFDHFQALVTTIVTKLRAEPGLAAAADSIGGSTYSIDVWPGHPLEAEAKSELANFRTRVSDLRKRAAAYNRDHEMPKKTTRVVIYGGQCVIDAEESTEDETSE